MRARRIGALRLLPALALAASGAAPAEPAAHELAALKRAYLTCDREASRRLLAPGEAMACSVIGEQLLQQGFGGDWERLLAWWRAAREGLS